MKYTYKVNCFALYEVDVEANSPEEAYKKAREQYEDAQMDAFQWEDEIADFLFDENGEQIKIK